MPSRVNGLSVAAVAALLVFAGLGAIDVSRAQSIESGTLAELDPWAVGAIARDRALPRDLWSQSDASTLSLLFDRVTPNIGSPAGAQLARQALLSPAAAPAGDTIVAARKRYEALARLGLADEIVSMVSGSGEAKRNVTQYSWGGYASTEFRIVPAERLIQIFARQQIPYTQDLAKKQFAIVYEASAAPSSAQAPTPDP